MLSCREIVRLMSSHEELSWTRRAELRMHLMMCKHCSAYAKHLKMMRDGFKKLFSKKTQVPSSEVEALERHIIEHEVKRRAGGP